MIAHDHAALFLYLSRQQPRSAICFLRSPILGLGLMPAVLRSVVSPCNDATPEPTQQPPVRGEWESESYWGSTKFEGEISVAVFDCGLFDVPDAALARLEASGVRSVLFRGLDGWYSQSILRRERSYLTRAGSEILFLAEQFVLRLRIAVRKTILRFVGRSPHELGVTSYHPELGHCFLAPLPQFCDRSDNVGKSDSPIVLFEEVSELAGHCHHAAVRQLGGGRYSHWADTLFFSATDNSNPNTNGRRYRIVDLSDCGRLLRFGLRVSRALDLVTDDCSHPIPATLGLAVASSIATPEKRYWRRAERIKALSAEEVEREFERRAPSSEPRGVALGETRGVYEFIGSLGPGGAERQAVYVSSELSRRGIRVKVGMGYHQGTDDRHYLPYLESRDVPWEFIGNPHLGLTEQEYGEVCGDAGELALFHSIPREFAREVKSLVAKLVRARPTVLHCWLDYGNVIGVVAGWLAGVPRIVLSTRNLEPTHFQRFYQPWFRTWYGILCRSPRVVFIANSRAGAKSYSKWLGIPEERFSVVHNGIDTGAIVRAERGATELFRQSLGISVTAPVVVGVFRLAEEKQPSRFLQVISRLKEQIPEVRALIAGIGPLEGEVRAEIQRLGLSDSVQLLGRRDDVSLVVSASDISLLTSSEEGFPNALLESQLLGVPAVSTDVGGVSEVLAHGVGGYVCEESVDSLTEHCVRLLRDADLRKHMGAAGRKFVQENFSCAKMIEETVKAFRLDEGQQSLLYGRPHFEAHSEDLGFDARIARAIARLQSVLDQLPAGVVEGANICAQANTESLLLMLLLMGFGAKGVALARPQRSLSDFEYFYYRAVLERATGEYSRHFVALAEYCSTNRLDHSSLTICVVSGDPLARESCDFMIQTESDDLSCIQQDTEHFLRRSGSILCFVPIGSSDMETSPRVPCVLRVVEWTGEASGDFNGNVFKECLIG